MGVTVGPEPVRADRSENPFRRAFWLGSVDPRPVALFRIGIGLTLLHDLTDYARDLRAFIGPDGMMPPTPGEPWWAWGVFRFVQSMPAVTLVYVLGCLAVLAFTVGYRTRIATVLSWIFIASLHHRNYYVTDGGDDLARILLFWSMFGDTGAAWSVDAWRRTVRVIDMPAFVTRLLQLHIGVLYFCAARLKLRQGWLHNEVIYQVLQLDGFVRPLGKVLGRFPDLCLVSTRMIVLMEMAFVFFAFAPVARKSTRAIAIALGLAIQGGILVTMRVGIFTETMLWVLVLWLQPEWIDAAVGWLRPRVGWLDADRRPAVTRPASRVDRWLVPVLGLQFTLAVWDQFVGARLPLPRPIQDERIALGVMQPMGLFDVVYDSPRWSAPGRLSDGRAVEVLDVAAPGTRARAAGVVFSRWYKFLFKEREFPYRFAELGAYLCRAYDERAPGSPLASFELQADMVRPGDRSTGQVVDKHLVLWQQTCPGTAR